MELTPIGNVESPLRDQADAPKQGTEGAPDAWLVFDERAAPGLDGLRVGDDVFVTNPVRLKEGIAKVLTAEAVKAKLANLGLVVVAGKPDELANVVKDGLKVRGELVKAAGILPE